METKGLTEKTYDDAKTVVLDRFGTNALSVLDAVMNNPMRKICEDAGDIVYDNGEPVCFQACMLRRLCLGVKELFGKVAGLTCLKNGAPPEAYIDVRIAANKPRAGYLIGFGNSQNAESAYAAHRLAKKKNPTTFEGPRASTRFLWRAIRPIDCLLYFIRRKVLKGGLPNWNEFSTLASAGYEVKRGDLTVRRLMTVKQQFFDVLMAEYLKANEGLVCSRTAEEVEWLFGERIKKGLCVALGVYKDEEPVGYIIARSNSFARRWQILDWFALGNKSEFLEASLAELCVFLKRKTPAMMLESVGFPMWVQPLLMRYLPHKRELGHNTFSWGSSNKDFRESVLQVIDSPKSWFFGPYDGDECMG